MIFNYDAFIDGDKAIKLENFHKTFHDYHPGDTIPMIECGYPKNGLVYCSSQREDVVVIIDSKFIGIIDFWEAMRKYDKFGLWRSTGKQILEPGED